MDGALDLAALASPDPRVRFGAEDRVRAAGATGIDALARFVNAGGHAKRLADRAADLLGTLLRETAVEAFRAAVPEPSSPSLWAGAVAISAEAHLDLDLPALERRMEDLVGGARLAVPAAGAVPARVGRLTDYLCRDRGFRGDAARWRDVRNSYLPDVLERRTGIPVTLAVLWMTVASRLGLQASGVGLPLHFVARCESEDGPLYVDAFHGDVLDEEGCRRLVARAAGREVALPRQAFRPLRPGEVLARMLRNLRTHHEQAGHLHMALASVDRLLHLEPLDGQALRDRAVLFARLSRPAAAARSLARALALEPDAPDRALVEDSKRRLQREAASRN